MLALEQRGLLDKGEYVVIHTDTDIYRDQPEVDVDLDQGQDIWEMLGGQGDSMFFFL